MDFSKVIEIILTQIPVLGALIWFLVYHTKRTDKREERIEDNRDADQKQYFESLNQIIDANKESQDKVVRCFQHSVTDLSQRMNEGFNLISDSVTKIHNRIEGIEVDIKELKK
ncbi:MAG: hypothetical protein LBT46_02795 [Planctomycetaceae bacterium]|nr:hypothetical protein [Planctomycetaceae bacterium]